MKQTRYMHHAHRNNIASQLHADAKNLRKLYVDDCQDLRKRLCRSGFRDFRFADFKRGDRFATRDRRAETRRADSESHVLATKKFSVIFSEGLIGARRSQLVERIGATDSRRNFCRDDGAAMARR